MFRTFALPPALAALTIAVALIGSVHPSPARAQAQGAYTVQPSAASSSPAGTTSAASKCANADSWCEYCGQHTSVSVCLNYAPGSGIASVDGGVNPTNASVGSAGDGGGMDGSGGGGEGGGMGDGY